MIIDTTADLRDFFRLRLVASLDERGFRVHRETEFYLVELMTRFAAAGVGDALQRPFVERLAQAADADGRERLKRFRALGDAALCACGFFSDYLAGKGIERGYVISMGNRAYRTASDLSPRAPRAATFRELAETFGDLADTLDDVRETTELRTPQDIVRLYDRWRQSGSQRIAARLRREGVFPVSGDTETLH